MIESILNKIVNMNIMTNIEWKWVNKRSISEISEECFLLDYFIYPFSIDNQECCEYSHLMVIYKA